MKIFYFLDVDKFWCSTDDQYQGNFKYCDYGQDNVKLSPKNGHIQKFIRHKKPSLFRSTERIIMLTSELKIFINKVISCANHGMPSVPAVNAPDNNEIENGSVGECMFPFSYNNQEHFFCTHDDEVAQNHLCYNSTGKMKSCILDIQFTSYM